MSIQYVPSRDPRAWPARRFFMSRVSILVPVVLLLASLFGSVSTTTATRASTDCTYDPGEFGHPVLGLAMDTTGIWNRGVFFISLRNGASASPRRRTKTLDLAARSRRGPQPEGRQSLLRPDHRPGRRVVCALPDGFSEVVPLHSRPGHGPVQVPAWVPDDGNRGPEPPHRSGHRGVGEADANRRGSLR